LAEVIAIENLSYSYPDGQPALRGVSLSINEGETVALMGPNGAGKSTLLLHLNGLLHSHDGKVSVLGQAVEEGNLKVVRKQVGLVFQNPDDQLFSPTVFDDVAFGPLNLGMSPDKVRRVVREALDSVGMAGYEKRSPHHLSLGEKRRIAIATVLAMSPRVLVLDEPTSNLDPGGKWHLIGLLRKLPGTKLIVSHDLELVQALCPRVIIMDRGSVIADGDREVILKDRVLLAAHSLAAPLEEVEIR
jgi:cobalt/nickel transport system ATP-binding protein